MHEHELFEMRLVPEAKTTETAEVFYTKLASDLCKQTPSTMEDVKAAPLFSGMQHGSDVEIQAATSGIWKTASFGAVQI